jgi:hypothetical protein
MYTQNGAYAALLQVRMYESVNFKGGSAGAEAVGNL